MILSGSLPNRTSRAVRAVMLISAFGLLPLGVARSQGAPQDETSTQATAQGLHDLIESGGMSVEDARLVFNALNPVDWVGQRYAAAAAEIDAAVEAGRLSVEEGVAKKDAVAETMQGIAFYMEVFGMTSDEAQKKVAAETGKRMRRGGKDKASEGEGEASLDWMYEHMMNAGIPREQLRDVMGAVKKVMAGMKSQGNDYQLDPKMGAYLTSLTLTDEQIKLVVGLSARAAARINAEGAPERGEADGIKGYYARLGIDGEAYDAMLVAVAEQGFDPQLNDQLMGALLRLSMAMKTDGSEYVLDPRMSEYLDSIGMSPEQVNWLEGLARRVSKGMGASDEAQARVGSRDGAGALEGYFERINIDAETYAVLGKKLAALGLKKVQILGVLRGLIRIIPAMRSEGDAFVLDEKAREYYASLGLSEAQIEKVLVVARSLS